MVGFAEAFAVGFVVVFAGSVVACSAVVVAGFAAVLVVVVAVDSAEAFAGFAVFLGIVVMGCFSQDIPCRVSGTDRMLG